jgi:hypothetical protein
LGEKLVPWRDYAKLVAVTRARRSPRELVGREFQVPKVAFVTFYEIHLTSRLKHELDLSRRGAGMEHYDPMLVVEIEPWGPAEKFPFRHVQGERHDLLLLIVDNQLPQHQIQL